MHKVECPSCSKVYEVPDSEQGRMAECSCGHRFQLQESPINSNPPSEAPEKASSTINCAHCRQELDVSELNDGDQFNCPFCQHPNTIGQKRNSTTSVTPPSTGATIIDDKQKTLSDLSENDSPPEMIARCRIEKLLAYGGMGRIYLATHSTLNIKVAVKIMLFGSGNFSDYPERFLREGQTAAKLNHPNIVRVYDCGKENGLLFLIMEYVDGGNLSQLLESGGPLPSDEVTEVALAIAKALEEAEKFGIVHRDIKPENIMYSKSEGVYKLADLGLAKQILDAGGASQEITMETVSMGTPLYMSPEQNIDAKSCDLRSDVYSLGATLYHLLTGNPPFSAPSNLELFKKHSEVPPLAPSESVPGVNPGLESIILKCLEKNPDSRYQSAHELIIDLSAVKDSPISSGIVAGDKLKNDLDSSAKNSKNRMSLGLKLVSAFIVLVVLFILVIMQYKQVSKPETDLIVESPVPDQSKIDLEDGKSKDQPKSGAMDDVVKDQAITDITDEKSRVDNPEKEDTPEVVENPEKGDNSPEVVENPENHNEAWGLTLTLLKRLLERDDKFPEALQLLEKAKLKFTGTKFETMADLKIIELEDEKKRRIDKVLKKLNIQAKKLETEKQFSAAANLYENYKASFAHETREQRKKFALDYRDRAKRNEIKKLFATFSHFIIKNDIKAARKTADEMVKNPLISNWKRDVASLSETLKVLGNIDQEVLKSLANMKGKKLSLSLRGNKENLIIEKIKGKRIFAKSSNPKGDIKREVMINFTVSELSPGAIKKLLSAIDINAVILSDFNREIRGKNYKKAKKILDKIPVLQEMFDYSQLPGFKVIESNEENSINIPESPNESFTLAPGAGKPLPLPKKIADMNGVWIWDWGTDYSAFELHEGSAIGLKSWKFELKGSKLKVETKNGNRFIDLEYQGDGTWIGIELPSKKEIIMKPVDSSKLKFPKSIKDFDGKWLWGWGGGGSQMLIEIKRGRVLKRKYWRFKYEDNCLKLFQRRKKNYFYLMPDGTWRGILESRQYINLRRVD